MRAWIGLGGNEENSKTLLLESLQRIDALAGTRLLRRSRLYQTPPWGIENQADFVNAVAELETGQAPQDLLAVLLDLEIALGRTRDGARWGPRCIDLDLLTYEDWTVESLLLELPHPRMHERAFVLAPLLELEPQFEIPGVGAAARCLAALDPAEVQAVVAIE